jgi:exopolysaccharide biosynthesis polyprenyl glycosylphosphotransferase
MINKLSHLPIYNFVLISCDILTTIIAFLLGLQITGHSVFLWGDNEAIIGLVILCSATISFFPTYHLYNYHSLFSRTVHLKNLIKALSWSTLTLTVIIFFLNSSTLLREHFHLFLIIVLCSSIILLLLSRYFWDHFLNFLMVLGLAILFIGIAGLACKGRFPMFITYPSVISVCFLLTILLLPLNRLFLVHGLFFNVLRKSFRRQIVIVGSDSDADNIAQYIVDNSAPFWIIGTLGQSLPSNGNLHKKLHKERLGEIDNLADIINQHDIDDIIITDEKITKPNLLSILDQCTTAEINAWFSPKLLPILSVKLFHDNFCGHPMTMLCSQKNSWIFNRVKQGIDILIALTLMLLLSPLFLCIALTIKLDSAGPIFYRFKAIGKKGEEYLMYKFRSMRVDADSAIHKDYVSQLIKGEIGTDENDDTPLKITNDPRVTKVGKVLRKLSLDELPQLMNVLQGVMSLVGPRPCLPYEFEIYQEWHKKRTSVRPGITGLWQIAGRSEVSFEDMILLDLYYIYNRSIALDFNILFETVFVVLEKKGGY